MKGNNELEWCDLTIDRDMEVDSDIGQEITVYIETWFDTDKKFNVHTDADEGSWINMYGKYNPFADTLYIECEISTEDNSPNETFDYEPTASEAKLIKMLIAEKIRKEYGQTPQEFCNSCSEEILMLGGIQ